MRRGRPDVANAVVGTRDPDVLPGRDRLSLRRRWQPLRLPLAADHHFRMGRPRGGGRSAEVRLAQLLPDRVEDPGRVLPRMRTHGLDSHLAQNGVVALPAEDLIREEVEVFVNPKAAAREHLVQRHSVRLVGVACQQMVLDRVRQPAGGRPVIGRHDPVGDERSIEGNHRVASTGKRIVPEASTVEDGPAQEGEDPRDEECAGPFRPLAPRGAEHQREDGKGEQQGISRTDEGKECHAESDVRKAP